MKREDDGTISLARANAEQRAIDKANKDEAGTAQRLAQSAIDSAFKSPFSRAAMGGRERKPVRPVTMREAPIGA